MERLSEKESVEKELSEHPWRYVKRRRGVVVSANADFGSTIQTGLGVNYSTVELGRKGYVELGLGLNPAVVLNEWRVDGLLIEGVGRAATNLLAVEFGLGMATGGERMRATGSISALGNWPWIEGVGLDLGYRYQFPIFPFERPEWLSGHFFTIRGHFPAWSGEKQWRDVSDPDSEWGVERGARVVVSGQVEGKSLLWSAGVPLRLRFRSGTSPSKPT